MTKPFNNLIRRGRAFILLPLLILALVLALNAHNTPKTEAAANATTPCVGAAPPSQWKHVIVLMFENKTYGSVIGSSSAPYITSLANACGTSPNAWKDADYNVDGTHNGSYNSKPNYATLTSGVSPTVHGLTDDTYSTTTGVNNIYNVLRTAGKVGNDYYDAGASSTPCAGSNFSGAYHDAIRYYTDLGSTYCNAHDVPLSSFMTDVNNNTLPDFSMIIPTNNENMHDNSISSGDTWAKNFLTPLLNSPLYASGNTAIFFLWDEDTNIPNVLLAPSIKPGSKVPTPPAGSNPINHFSALRTWEEMLGLPLIGDTGKATSLLSFFGGQGTTPPPSVDNPPAVSITSPTSGSTITTSPVTVSANATDDHGVTKVEFYDGSTLLTTDTASPYTYSWNVSSLSGSHTLTAKAYDTGGHVTTSSAVNVTISIGTVINCPYNNLSTSLGTDTMTVNVPATATYHVWSRVMAPDTANNTYYFKADTNCPVLVGGTGIPANTWTWVDYQNSNANAAITMNLTAGNHTITLIGAKPGVKLDRVMLLANTCTPSGTGGNCTDTTAPTVSLSSPAAGATLSGTTTLTATATDNSGGTGVATVEFLVDGNVVGSSANSPYSYSWNTTGVADGTHTIQARATDNSGNSATSSSVSITVKNATNTTLNPPTGLRSTANTSNEVDLSWTASANASGYNVYRNNVAVNSSPITGTSYKDTSVMANTSYTYTVTAVSSNGTESAKSSSIQLTTPASTDTQAPSAPAQLSATGTTGTSTTLNWTGSTDNVGVTGYYVERDGAVVGTVTTTHYTDTGILPGTTYTYYVIAFDAAGNASSPSNTITVATQSASDTQAPTVPSNLTATINGQQINLSWTQSTDNQGVMGYNVYRDGTKLTSSVITSMGDATVNPGQTYTYYVTAFDAAGNESSKSNQVTITFQPASTGGNNGGNNGGSGGGTGGGDNGGSNGGGNGGTGGDNGGSNGGSNGGGQTITIKASDAVRIKEKDAHKNFAGNVTMDADKRPLDNSLIKFNVSGINGRTVTSATLRMWVADGSPDGGRFRTMVSNNWNARHVTWSNAPAATGPTIAHEGRTRTNSYVTIDLGDFIHGDGTYSLRVDNNSPHKANYSSGFAPTVDHRPTLILTVQ